MIKPSFLFTDNAVIQRDREVAVFGECDCARLTVSFSDASVSAQIIGGRFFATLPPMKGNICSTLSFESESEMLTFKNVVTGDVWLCSGQSNMEHPTFCTCYGDDTVEGDGSVRLFTVPRRVYKDASEWAWHFYAVLSEDTPWKVFDSESAKRFSAVGVNFVKSLRRETDVPIGLISCDRGATNMEAWISREALLTDPVTSYWVNEYDKKFGGIDMAEYERLYDESYRQPLLKYMKEVDPFKTVEEKGASYKLRHEFSHAIPEGPYHTKAPAICWENMLTRVAPFTISGVIWYQGESNSADTPLGVKTSFKALMKMMVSEWRRLFNDEKLPFYTVQIAMYPYGNESGRNAAWVREAQEESAREIEGVYMVSAIDEGERDNIHPVNKYFVGSRLANAVLANHYGKDVLWRSPTVRRAVKNGDEITLELDNARELLCVLPKPQSFYVEDKDGNEKEAEAELKGSKVIIKSSDAVAVSYCYRNFAVPNIIEPDGALPLLPFYKKL